MIQDVDNTDEIISDNEEGSNNHQKDCNEMILSSDRMRRKLQFFFMNPVDKWHAKRRLPYKFAVQLIKIMLVTLQLCLFASSSYTHVNYTWDNRVTFAHLFLRGWDASREVNAYPPGNGPLACYTKDDFFETIDYAVVGYANIDKAIGPYSYVNENNTMGSLKLCLYQYKEGTIFGFNESYIFNSEIIRTCYNISGDLNSSTFDSREYFHDVEINFSALVKAALSFGLKTVSFKSAGPITPPNCYQFDIVIKFINADHDGQMVLELDAEPRRLQCKGDIEYITDNEIDSVLRSVLNYLVIIVCAISFVLCSRAIWRAQQLKMITDNFFKRQFNKPLSPTDKNEFLNYWYITIIINDLCIITGSAIKEQIESKEFTSDQWNICSVFLGTGNMLVWFGVLRYLGFYSSYNVVILTLKKATPQMARFLLCALSIYAGFTFCGCLVLGPYHMKFRSLSSTAECLYSLVNGDDMFATFATMSTKSTMLWWYSRFYLYAFISLYICVILNLFITVINDAYETIKLYHKEGFPKSDLSTFIGEKNIKEVSGGLYRSNSDSSLGGLMKDLCCCKRIQKSYSSLIDSRNSIPV